jgi:thymidine kinase
MKGSISLVIGGMFSGKSTELLRIIKRWEVIGKKIMVINHSFDDRYSNNKIATHDKQFTDCISTECLIPLMDTYEYRNSDIIVIEEGQFFKDLFEFTTTSADKNNKKLVIAGLDGDSNREPFGDILRLIPHSESVIKLSAICLMCNDGTTAHFSKRLNNSNDSQVQVGTGHDYVAVCRKHFLEN